MHLAIVTPWFGPELIGGAERLAWDLSRALVRAKAEVDVLTTCCRSFHDDWAANYHRPGATTVEGVVVRRFRVDARDRVAFSRANSALLGLRREQLGRDRAPLPAAQTDAFLRESIRSAALVKHLREHSDEYDAVLFLPYLYGTTIDGLPVVADKAILLPCLHDEAYAYLDGVRDVFRSARGLFFNSEGELDVAASLYGPWVYARAHVVGHAVDAAVPRSVPVTVKGFAPHRSRYLLFLGRGDRTKNLDLAVEAYVRFRERRRATALQFVVAGPHARHLRKVEGVVELGAVSEPVKAALLANARALVQPSTNESFSRTVYEAWHQRRPVVVHSDCSAIAGVVDESGGGWTARTADEWASVFATIDESSDADVDGAGLRGRATALESGTWDDVAARTLAALHERLGAHYGTPIEQIVPLDSPEAASYAAALDGALRAVGVDARVSIEGAPHTAAKVIRHVVQPRVSEPADAYILHCATAEIPFHAPVFAAKRVPGIRLLPRPVDIEKWSRVQRLAPPASDDAINVLSLATLDAADAERLLEILAVLRTRASAARLFLFEEHCVNEARDALLGAASALGLQHDVEFVSPVPDTRYAALRSASIACALGRQLTDEEWIVQAMWSGVPIVSHDDPLVQSVTDGCAVFCDRGNALETAVLVRLIASDAAFRKAVIAEMKHHRAYYAPRYVVTALLGAMGTKTPPIRVSRFPT